LIGSPDSLHFRFANIGDPPPLDKQLNISSYHVQCTKQSCTYFFRNMKSTERLMTRTILVLLTTSSSTCQCRPPSKRRPDQTHLTSALTKV